MDKGIYLLIYCRHLSHVSGCGNTPYAGNQARKTTMQTAESGARQFEKIFIFVGYKKKDNLITYLLIHMYVYVQDKAVVNLFNSVHYILLASGLWCFLSSE